MQNYTMQRKDIAHNPFSVEENDQNTSSFTRPFKVLSVIFHLIPVFGLYFEYNVLSKLKALL